MRHTEVPCRTMVVCGRLRVHVARVFSLYVMQRARLGPSWHRLYLREVRLGFAR